MRRSSRALSVVSAFLLALTAAGLAPIPRPAIDADLQPKLRALAPENREAYFLLAEEVAERGTVAADADTLNLAKTLYALAFELDRRTGQAGPLAASSALGLASIERLERDRRWLTAVAGAIDRRYSLPDWTISAGGSISDEQAYDAATVLGLARAGMGRDARKLIDKPGVRQTLTRYERLIGTTGETGALSRLEKYMAAWPCPECNNERVVRKMGDHGPELRLCPTCHGNPGPDLSDEEYIGQLRFEAALLNGIQRSWAAQVIVDQAAPLRDPDPDELAATYRVDATHPYWRDGRWTDKP
jgi:hypothetical protein